MKRLMIVIAAVLIPTFAGAQAQINTKKVKIEDFTQKVTKIVLTGNIFYDSTLEDEVTSHWRVSPYEFCTFQEFEQLKGNEDYYFLLTTKGQFKKESEPGLMFLTLVKGGPLAEKSINNMLEIISLPTAAAEDPSGREMLFLPAFLTIIQNHALESMESDITAYAGLHNFSLDLTETKGMRMIFAEDDLSSEIDKAVRKYNFDKDMHITDVDEADRYMSGNSHHAVVSYVAAPTNAKPGSYCYKMLIDNSTYQLYYFKKHRITKNTGPGFLVEDIKRITSFRAK